MSRLAIIVPFRDRQSHLEKFIPHMHSYLRDKGVDYNIFIIEQRDNKPFNRGKLLNVGFKETCGNYDYYCFHDVDMLPANNDCDYSYTDGACRLSHFVSQFGFVPRPPNEFGGGVIMVNKSILANVNGFSNDYWGWGVEDSDFSHRCSKADVEVEFRKGRYFSLSHEPNGDTSGKPASPNTVKNRVRFSQLQQDGEVGLDGLTNLEYEVVSKKETDKYTLISVNL